MEFIIIKYIDYAIELEEINKDGLSHGNNLRRNNSLADKLRKIAQNIESKTPKCKNAFAELLRHDNSNVRMWCAHHILEVMNYDDETRKNALLIIKDASFVSYGEKLWLKNWINNNPQDALLI